jgi:hypothetical protein
MSKRDIELARAISAAARELGLSPDPDSVQSVLVIPGATDTSAVMPFWQAALGYVRRGDTPDEDLVDPRGRGPSFWFEQMEEPRSDGGGAIHIAVWVPAEHAEARVAAAANDEDTDAGRARPTVLDRSLGRASLSVGETPVHEDSCVEVSISRPAVRLTATRLVTTRR